MLPAVGTCTYNGIDFGASVRTSIQGTPLYDEADRTVVAMVYTLTARAIILETVLAGGTDDQVENIRIKLSKPGQSLAFSSKGFGELNINSANVKDVMWGPKPRVIRLTPLGSKAAWELEWSCEVAIPECTAALYQFGIMAFNFEGFYSFDENRYTTRTISGYLEIPMTRRNGGRSMPDCVDLYRERIKIPIPFGFRRTAETYRVSADKRRLDFNFVDQEMPGEALPEGCTDARGSFSVASTDWGLIQFATTISASYVVSKGVPRRRAYEAFYALYVDRIEAFIRNRQRKGDLAGVPIVTGFRVDEGLYLDGRSMTFELTYLLPTSIVELFEDSGIWRSVPFTNSQRWQASLAGALGPRALAGLGLSPSEDVIIDLCGQTQTRTANTSSDSFEVNLRAQPATTAPEGLLHFQNELRTSLNPQMTTYSPPLGEQRSMTSTRYPKGSIGSLPLDSNQTPVLKVDDNAPDFLQAGPQDKFAHRVQVRMPDRFYVRMRGFAVTTWKPIAAPKMVKLGDGSILTPFDSHSYTQRFLGLIGGSTPVYLTQWDQTYLVIPLKKNRAVKAPVIRYRTIQEEQQRFLQMRPLGAWGRPSVDLSGVFGDG